MTVRSRESGRGREGSRESGRSREGQHAPPLGHGASVLLGPPPQVHQQAVLQRVDGLVGVEAGEARLPLRLRLHGDGRQRQQVVLVAEASDGPHVQEGPLGRHLGGPPHTHMSLCGLQHTLTTVGLSTLPSGWGRDLVRWIKRGCARSVDLLRIICYSE